jgi:kynurenine formamidase
MHSFPFEIVDLTHSLTAESPSWNGSCGYVTKVQLDYKDSPTSVGFRVQNFKMHAGIGTHIDAPAHCVPDGKTVDALPLSDLIAPLICMNVSSHLSEDFVLSKENVIDFEQAHGQIEPGAFVLIYTGWDVFWSTPAKYHNQHRFPSIGLAAASLLLARGVIGLGIDTLSPDLPTSGYPVHQIFLGAGHYMIENVANASILPARGAYILALPLKGEGLTESPVRLVAFVKKT